jgi:hypothetical protein
MIVGALLSGGVALAGFGLTAATAQAARTGRARRSTRTSVSPWSSASGAVAAFPASWTSPASIRAPRPPLPSKGSASDTVRPVRRFAGGRAEHALVSFGETFTRTVD